ncbi:MAG: hypothetical protein EUB_03930 [Eubacterium sp.]|uniref:hypothetical protein n=1 Tax=Eubacterium sp. TaxID=142586 RepID=UPI00304C8AA2
MNDEALLNMLKQDLEILHAQKDDYLKSLLKLSRSLIAREGIVLAPEPDSEDGGLMVMYAAWLYRKRANDEAVMPRMLRYALNNRLMPQKEGAGNAT